MSGELRPKRNKSEYRKVIEDVLKAPVQLVEVQSDKEFIHLDNTQKGWRLIISKSLLGNKL